MRSLSERLIISPNSVMSRDGYTWMPITKSALIQKSMHNLIYSYLDTFGIKFTFSDIEAVALTLLDAFIASNFQLYFCIEAE
jgi:hypothetical protein